VAVTHVVYCPGCRHLKPRHSWGTDYCWGCQVKQKDELWPDDGPTGPDMPRPAPG
jgi:hypothetical protein